MKCEYCLTDGQRGERCEKCGAPLPERQGNLCKSEPFFYNGYICYQMRDHMNDMTETQFWLGRELIERINLPLEAIRQHVPEFGDPMVFIWDLFLLARGEKEVLEYKEQNTRYPARFEIRRIENEERKSWASMSIQELYEAFH